MEEIYWITHIGGGDFNALMIDGNVKKVGESLQGIIKYTYFEETNDLPEVGWSVSHLKLMEDYIPKIQAGILSGKIKPE